MCGISLVLEPSGSAAVNERLGRMHAPIRHRGPDGEGFMAVRGDGSVARCGTLEALPALGATLGVAFRRLRILDLTEAAAQPMPSPGRDCWIVFNGEIYNYRELRRELAAAGRQFHTQGDTEVALAAYEAWGERCFERLDGMWALAVIDLGRRRLLLSRDRFGIKPLYWALDGAALLVASEIRQIVAARRQRPRPHAPLVAMFLRGTRYPCLEETFFEDIQSVPPAAWCEVPLEQPPVPPRFRPYWRLSDFHCDPAHAAGGYEAARQRFAALLADAVASHSVADVEVGALLSGGLDSSTLAGLLGPAARRAGRTCPTFSFGVRDAPLPLCELPYAESVARAQGLVNHQTGLDAEWVRERAPDVVRTLEEPPLAPPALAQYRTFELCRQHGTTVVLDGQGADEVLGGYPYHQRRLLLDRLRCLRLREFGRELRAIGAREHVSRLRLLGALAVPPLRQRLRGAPHWLAGEGMRPQTEEVRRARSDRGQDASALNRQLYWDVRWGNVKIVLGYTDKNAMAHSVEARVPYFDRRLVEFAFGLPDHFKVGDGQRKRILRDMARGLLPAEVTDRPDRMGFALPTRELMQSLFPDARAAILEGGLLAGPWFVRGQAERMLERFGRGAQQHAEAVWRLYALALWAREFDVPLA